MGILHELPQISLITILRFISITDTESIGLNGFADASQCVYGACLYIRASSSSKVIVKLSTAKSKVSPFKIISIPRLELCAALLPARLSINVSRDNTGDKGCFGFPVAVEIRKNHKAFSWSRRKSQSCHRENLT